MCVWGTMSFVFSAGWMRNCCTNLKDSENIGETYAAPLKAHRRNRHKYAVIKTKKAKDKRNDCEIVKLCSTINIGTRKSMEDL